MATAVPVPDRRAMLIEGGAATTHSHCDSSVIAQSVYLQYFQRLFPTRSGSADTLHQIPLSIEVSRVPVQSLSVLHLGLRVTTVDPG